MSPWARLGTYLIEVLLLTVTLAIGWFIWATMAAGESQTPAKKIPHQFIIGRDTNPPAGFGRMFWMRGLLDGFVAQVVEPLRISDPIAQ
jgi:hypothetical protein